MITTKCSICGKEIKLVAKWKGFDERKLVCPNHTNKELIINTKKLSSKIIVVGK